MAISLLFGGIAGGVIAKSQATKPTVSRGTVRVLDLPRDSIGSVCTAKVEGLLSDLEPVSAASGRVKVLVEPNYWLILDFNRKIIAHPELLKLVPQNAFDGVKVGFMSMEEVESSQSDSIIAHLAQLPNLKCLLLERSDATDKGLLSLKKMPKLQQLSASMTGVNGSFLQKSENFPDLQYLVLFDCKLDSNQLAGLTKLPKLKYLDVHHADIGDEALASVAKCPHLETLRLSENARISDRGLKLLSGLKQLSKLELQDTSITFEGLKKLQPLSGKLLSVKVSPNLLSRGRAKLIGELFPHAQIEGCTRGKSMDATIRTMYAPLH